MRVVDILYCLKENKSSDECQQDKATDHALWYIPGVFWYSRDINYLPGTGPPASESSL